MLFLGRVEADPIRLEYPRPDAEGHRIEEEKKKKKVVDNYVDKSAVRGVDNERSMSQLRGG